MIELLSNLRNGVEFKKTLNRIFAASETPELRKELIGLNFFGVLKYEGIASKVRDFQLDVAAIKVMLCKEHSYARYIGLEIEEMRDSVNFILTNTQPKPDDHGIYLPIQHLNSEFPQLPVQLNELLGYNLLILYELGLGSSEIANSISKYNMIPKLLFIIEKGPLNVMIGEQSLKKIAQKLLNLILSYVDVATEICVRLDLFKWILRIAKQDLFKASETEMMETLSFLSFSDQFLPKTEDELIVNEWVYLNLCMILIPEKRSDAFLMANKGVPESGYMRLISILSQILGNVSKSQGGIEEILAALEAYGTDIVWRIHYTLVKFNIKEFSVWYTVLYLTNNMLRYPYYNPPIYASQVAVQTYNLIGNISSILLTIACRAFRYLEFSSEDKIPLCAVATARISKPTHSVRLNALPAPNTLNDSASILRNHSKMTKEWNLYFENKKKPWETIYSPAHTPANYTEPIHKYVHSITEQFKQYKLFFKKLPKPCEYCNDFEGPPFLPEDEFWNLYSPQFNSHIQDIESFTPIVLIQFLSVISESEDLNFILNNLMYQLNPLLVMGEGMIEERIKCAIITLYVTWTELREGFIHFYLSTGLLYYHQYYNSLTLQSLSKTPLTGVNCTWDSAQNTFKLNSVKLTPTNSEVNLWRIHILFHLLELFRTVLRVASKSVRHALKTQCIGLIDLNYILIINLYEFIETEPKIRGIINAVISTTEEVSYVIIRTIPGLFYVIADSIFNKPNMIKIYIDMTGFLPSLLSLYTHISSFYLFLSKDKTKKMSLGILNSYLETFAHSILKVLGNICTNIDQIETSNKKNVDVGTLINDKLEKILLVKCVYFLLLALLHCFDSDLNSVDQISALTYMRIYERLKKITYFTESNFANKSVEDSNYDFPQGFSNSDLRLIPGSRNYIIVDFEHENEDTLFRTYLTSVLTWIWYLSKTDNICVEIIVNPFTRDIFRILFEYEYWNIHSYMSMCSVIYNFTIMRTHTVLNCLPLAIPIIVKLLSEMKIPIEGYLLLIQSIREIYPKIITPSIIQQIQQLIAPLRTILSLTNPVLKYYNYPLLKNIGKKNVQVLEDESIMTEIFPKQLLSILPVEYVQDMENYPGQRILQSESRSLIKMITPVTYEGVAKTRQKITMHVKAGEGDLLVYKPVNTSREEKMSMFFNGVGSKVISNHYSIAEADVLKNKRSIKKLDEGFNRLMSDLFDKEHDLNSKY